MAAPITDLNDVVNNKPVNPIASCATTVASKVNNDTFDLFRLKILKQLFDVCKVVVKARYLNDTHFTPFISPLPVPLRALAARSSNLTLSRTISTTFGVPPTPCEASKT